MPLFPARTLPSRGSSAARAEAVTGVSSRRRWAAAVVSAGLCLGSVLVGVAPAHADSIRDGEYWLKQYGVTKAWESSKGAGVTVAVIDSGIDIKHPDLVKSVSGGTDVSGAGAPDGSRPIGGDPEHGTLVASLLAGRGHVPPPPKPDPKASGKPSATPTKASTDPSAGMMGVAPEASLLSISTWLGSANPGGRTDVDQIPDAVRWAVDNGAKVINISLGSSSPDWPQSWDAAFLYAEQKDVVIVAAAGNRGGGVNQVGAPATIPGVLTVGGLTRDNKASWDSSSQGISIAVTAPAEQLEGALPGGGYATWDGTSGAAPIVAGVAALIRSRYPDLSAANVINRIIRTATPAGASGRDPLYGFGIINADKAVNADVASVDSNPLGTLEQWINVHRRGAGAGPGEGAATGKATLPPSTLTAPAAPVAVASGASSDALPASMVLGSAGLLSVIVVAGALHLRRVGRREKLAHDAGSETAVESAAPAVPESDAAVAGPGAASSTDREPGHPSHRA